MKSLYSKSILSVAATLFLLSSCATEKGMQTVGQDVKVIKDKVDKELDLLKKDQEKTKSTLSTVVINQANTKDEIENLAITIENLMAKADESTFFSKKVLDEMKSINKHLDELNTLTMESGMKAIQREDSNRDEIELSFTEIRASLDEIYKVLDKLEKEKSKKEKEARKKKVVAQEPKVKPPEKKTTPVPAKILPEQLYQNAYKNFINGEYEQSLLEFQEYIKRFPKEELVDNCQYWTGESLLKLGDKKSAIEAFLKVEKNYPASPKVAEALFRAAEIMEKTGESKKAEQTLVKIRDNYPNSLEAGQALKKLAKLPK